MTINPTSGPIGTTITLSGTGFAGMAGQIICFWGGTRQGKMTPLLVKPDSAGNWQITFQVPDYAPPGQAEIYYNGAPTNGRSVASVYFNVLAPVQPTPTPSIPGGVWVSPSDQTTTLTVGSDGRATLHLEARAYTNEGRGGAGVNYVDFTVGWPGDNPTQWQMLCPQVRRPNNPDTYTCDYDFAQLPGDTFRISFDVYDQTGNKNLAPNGTKSVRVQRPQPPSRPAITITTDSSQYDVGSNIQICYAYSGTSERNLIVTITSVWPDGTKKELLQNLQPNPTGCISVPASNPTGVWRLTADLWAGENVLVSGDTTVKINPTTTGPSSGETQTYADEHFFYARYGSTNIDDSFAYVDYVGASASTPPGARLGDLICAQLLIYSERVLVGQSGNKCVEFGSGIVIDNKSWDIYKPDNPNDRAKVRRGNNTLHISFGYQYTGELNNNSCELGGYCGETSVDMLIP